MSSWRSAASSLKGTINNVATSVATVQASRASGRAEGSFLAQVRDQWGRDRAGRRSDEENGLQKLALFPGWAVRRKVDDSSGEDMQFSVDVFVSGYAYSMRPPEYASRSQKAFMKIARGFASLPKLSSLQNVSSNSGNYQDSNAPYVPRLSKSTEDLLKLASLPPRPDEMTPEMERKVLASIDRPLSPLEPPRPSYLAESETKTSVESGDLDDDSPAPHSSLYNLKIGSTSSVSSVSSVSSLSSLAPSVSFAGLSSSELTRLHANFDSRLQPFWGNIITNRTVRISIFTSHHILGHADHQHGPLASVDVPLTEQGYFGHLFNIPFEALCTHPGGLHIAFGNPMSEYNLVASAELLPLPLRDSPLGTASVIASQSARPTSTSYAPSIQSQLHSSPATAQLSIALTNARVRVISDIDDTVKVSNILHGARAVFRNVFVRHLDELAVAGMPEWYTNLSKRGVRFHYVSNSPFELLPVLSEFFRVVGLPTGSLKLKFYGGRSLFRGLWEPAGERKKAGVVEILNQFPESKFILVGDSGEQDLELYASLAKDFARQGRDQIRAIFIRDVTPNSLSANGNTSNSSSQPPSPTIARWAGSLPPTPASEFVPGRSSFGSASYFTPNPEIRSSVDSSSPSERDLKTPTGTSYQNLTPRMLRPPPLPKRNSANNVNERSVLRDVPKHRSTGESFSNVDPALAAAIASASGGAGTSPTGSPSSLKSTLEKKRVELQLRIARARSEIPPNVVFRVFEHPSDCFDDANAILNQLGVPPLTDMPPRQRDAS